jgi:hypothetical protein
MSLTLQPEREARKDNRIMGDKENSWNKREIF